MSSGPEEQQEGQGKRACELNNTQPDERQGTSGGDLMRESHRIDGAAGPLAAIDADRIQTQRKESRDNGRPVAAGEATPTKANFTARLHPGPVRDVAAMRGLLDSNEVQILDARSAGRFAGREPEPRPGVRPGHIPGALSLPYTEIVDGGSLKPPEALAAAFARAGVDTGRPVVTSCGSGLTACILGLALSRLGHDDWAVYDGSWAEWGGRHDLPIEGEA